MVALRLALLAPVGQAMADIVCHALRPSEGGGSADALGHAITKLCGKLDEDGYFVCADDIPSGCKKTTHQADYVFSTYSLWYDDCKINSGHGVRLSETREDYDIDSSCINYDFVKFGNQTVAV